MKQTKSDVEQFAITKEEMQHWVIESVLEEWYEEYKVTKKLTHVIHHNRLKRCVARKYWLKTEREYNIGIAFQEEFSKLALQIGNMLVADFELVKGCNLSFQNELNKVVDFPIFSSVTSRTDGYYEYQISERIIPLIQKKYNSQNNN